MCADKRHIPAKQQGHTARKRFGQHFLTDAHVIDEIVDSIDPRPSEALVEIGPGLGALTNPVLAHIDHMTVIELDRDLAARLRTNKKLAVIESDVLRVDFRALSEQLGQPLRVIGNLPYNISTPILFHLLPFADAIVDQHFMLQKEVVDRMVAKPGTKDFSRLSVMLQWRYAMSNQVNVPPDAFDPPPRVDSAVVRMRPLPAADVAHIDAHRLGQLVTIAFSQRRKILRHTLGAWIREQGLDTTFDVQRRAEEVPVAEYVSLSLLAAKS